MRERVMLIFQYLYSHGGANYIKGSQIQEALPEISSLGDAMKILIYLHVVEVAPIDYEGEHCYRISLPYRSAYPVLYF